MLRDLMPFSLWKNFPSLISSPKHFNPLLFQCLKPEEQLCSDGGSSGLNRETESPGAV